MRKIKKVLEIAWNIRIHWNIESSLRQCSYLNFLLVLIFFPRLEKLLVTLLSNTFSASVFLSSPASPTLWMLLCLMLFQRSLKLPSNFKILFCALIGCFLLFSLLGHIWLPLSHLIFCWFPLVYFSFLVLYSNSDWFI